MPLSLSCAQLLVMSSDRKSKGPLVAALLIATISWLLHERPYGEGRGAVDRVGGTGGLVRTFRGDGEGVDLSSGLADRKQVVAVIPEHLADRRGSQQAGEVRDGTGSVEMKSLQTLFHGHSYKFSRGRHLHVIR